MDYFSIIKDADVFENPDEEPKKYKERPTAKGIVLDSDGKIALLSNGEHSLFPGGGVDEGETFEEAFIRECKEEIGCDIEVLYPIGNAYQYRAKNMTKYDVLFFVGCVIGQKGIPTSTSPGELACTISWLSEVEILKILEEQIPHIREDDYAAHFNCPTHLVAFRKYLGMKK
jgi:8-oxo-dGTP diphosphatase